MEKDDFIRECVTLCGLDRGEILKRTLQQQLREEDLRPSRPGSDQAKTEVPKGLSVLLHQPCRQNFAEYAFEVCSLKESKDTIVKFLISANFDGAVGVARTKQNKKRKCTRSLPSQLGLFVDVDGKTSLTNMAKVLEEYFPGLSRVGLGIYADRSKGTFLLFVADGGEDGCKNSWRSAGTLNMLAWSGSTEEVSKDIFQRISSNSSAVHVVRKRGSELRYMGKANKVEEVNIDQQSCVLYVG
jgi:hypothetical protein